MQCAEDFALPQPTAPGRRSIASSRLSHRDVVDPTAACHRQTPHASAVDAPSAVRAVARANSQNRTLR
jgi:hypothetical protein